MVWVITGQLNGDKNLDLEALVPESSHYLRPSRSYTLGRAVVSASKSHQRAHDFTIKSNFISSSGAWTLVTGSWTAEQVADDPSSATNLDPYALHFTTHKILKIIREGEPIHLRKEETLELRAGDRVCTTAAYAFTVDWIPIFPCVATATDGKKKEYVKQAVSLGIKLGYKTFELNRHTHYLPKALLPGVNIFHAAMSAVPICSPLWLDAFIAAGHVEPVPAYRLRWDGNEDRSKFEDRLLKFKDGVGSDYERWWGHSELEKDWTTRPDPTELLYACGPAKEAVYSSWTWEKWNRDERRKELFEGILLVSFREEGTVNSLESECVKLGGGAFLTTSLDKHANDPASIVAEIDAFKTSEGFDPSVKLVIIAPRVNDTDNDEDMPEMRVLRIVAHRLGVSQILPSDNQSLINAIYAVDTSELVGPPFDPTAPEPTLDAPPPPKSKGRVLVPASSSLQQSNPASTFGSTSTFQFGPATHPEEQSILPEIRHVAVDAAKQGGMVAGPSGTTVGEGEDQEMAPPPPPRKLTRRAKTASSDLWSTMRSEQETRDLATQGAAPELSLDSTMPGSSIDLESSLPSSYQVRPRLKRRAGTVETQQSDLFDVPDPDRRPAKKSSQQLAEEEAAEDAARSQAYSAKSSPAKGKGAALSAVNEEEEEEFDNAEAGPSKTSKSKKRAASEAVSSDDEASTSQRTSTKKRPRTASEPTPEPTPVVAVSKKKPPPVKKGAAAKTGGKTAPVPDDGLLRIKNLKRKGAEVDQAMNDEFNALKLVRPTFEQMKAPQSHRIDWDEVDLEEEHMRLVREDEENGGDPEAWGGEGGKGMFVVERQSMVRKDRPPPRTDLELEDKYVGRKNFKKFRPKNSILPVVPREQRPRIVFASFAEPADFGLGDAYRPAKEKSKERAFRTGQDFDSDDSDDGMGAAQAQSKLSFTAKAKAKPVPKGKKKQVIVSSSDESSHTLRDAMDVDEMDLDDSDDDVKVVAGPSKGKAPAKVSQKVSARKPPTRTKAAPAKKAPPTMMIDSGSDEEDSRTFKGFGGTKRKR